MQYIFIISRLRTASFFALGNKSALKCGFDLSYPPKTSIFAAVMFHAGDKWVGYAPFITPRSERYVHNKGVY